MVIKDPNINIDNIKNDIKDKFIPEKELNQIKEIFSLYEKYKNIDKKIQEAILDKNTKSLRKIYDEMFDDIIDQTTSHVMFRGFSSKTEGTKFLLKPKSDFNKILMYLVENANFLDRISGKELI